MVALTLWLLAAIETAAAEPPGYLSKSPAPCVACLADAQKAAAIFTADEWLRLERGRIVKHPGRRDANSDSLARAEAAAGLIPHAPERVWSVLTDFEKWPSFMPHITSTEITHRNGSRQWVRQIYSVLFMEMQHTTIYRLDPGQGRLDWELDLSQKRDIRSSRGNWELYARDSGQSTLVRYIADIDAGRTVPGFVEKMLTGQSIGALFASLRGELDLRYGEPASPAGK